MKKFFGYNLILILIIILGLFLRVWDVNNNPRALYGDELTLVYDSYSLLKTGHDQLGNLLPFTFEMGAGRPAGYVYGSIPFVAIFGPSALGVRALSVLSGVGIILLMYLLGKKLFDKKTGLLVAFLTAINPWDLSLSRGGFESHFALFLTLVGIYIFLSITKRYWGLIISFLLFGVSINTYPTYKLTLPLFVPLLVWFKGHIKEYIESKNKMFVLISTILLVFILSLTVYQTLFSDSEKRFMEINALADKNLQEQIIQEINQDRTISSSPESLTKIFHNKVLENSLLFGENYINNFSFDFLFLNGDRNPRHNVLTMGGLYIVEILTIFFGVLLLFDKNKKYLGFLIGWVLIAALPATLLVNLHQLRSAFMLPPLLLISGVGFKYLWENKKLIYKLIFGLVVIGLIFQFLLIINNLYFLSPNKFNRFWALPAKMASDFIIQNSNNYDVIVISDKLDNIEYAYQVYAKIDPSIVIEQNKQKIKIGNTEFKKFDKVYIGPITNNNIDEQITNFSGKILYIGPVQGLENVTDYQLVLGPDQLGAYLYKEYNK